MRTSNDKTHVDEHGRPLKFAKPSRACPAEVEPALLAKLTAAAQQAHVALGCRDYSLYDFRVDPQASAAPPRLASTPRLASPGRSRAAAATPCARL